jgi:hypothetical protein
MAVDGSSYCPINNCKLAVPFPIVGTISMDTCGFSIHRWPAFVADTEAQLSKSRRCVTGANGCIE